MLTGFGDNGRHFSKICTETFKKNVHNPKRRRPRFQKKSKAVLIGIRYRKTSQTQDIKSQSTKRNLRGLAQPKPDSAFEQKTRIVSSREVWGSSQNRLFSYNQRKKASRAQKDNFGTYSTSFWKFCFPFGEIAQYSSEGLCENHQNQCTQYRTTKTTFPKKSKAVFLSIRYRKTSQTQDVKSQSTKRSLRKLAQAKPNTTVEQK